MKKFITLSVAMLAAYRLKILTAGAWFKKTHISIVEQAFEILCNDEKSDVAEVLGIFRNKIIEGATLPDVKGDCDNGSGMHYYCPKNKFGFKNKKRGDYYPDRLGRFSKSAGTMLEENYTTALVFWQNKKYDEAAVLLGRAIHFLSDMCCAPHTTSKVCSGHPRNCHMSYETSASKLTGVYNAMTSKSLYKSYYEMLPIEIANALSEFSSDYFDKLVSRSNDEYAVITASTLPFSQMAAAALLNKFYKQTSDEPLISENKFYAIKNCRSGLYLSADGTLDKSEHQFRIKLFHNGSVGFESTDGKILTITKKHTRFRLALCDENLKSYRITCARKFSKNIADIPLAKLAVAASFKPESDLHYWTIREC